MKQFTLTENAKLARFVMLIIVIVFTSCLVIFQFRQTRNNWDPDGEIYLWMAMQDRGASQSSALASARRFMLGEILQVDASSLTAGLYSSKPPDFWTEQFQLFKNRPIYPLLSSKLLPLFGPLALKIVSMLAYVLSAMAIFAMLSPFCSPSRSALGAIIFATEPVVLHTATMDLTDQTALLFWICALWGILRMWRSVYVPWLAMVCLSSVMLTLTRPAFYLPFGAAVGAYHGLSKASGRKSALAPLLAVLPAVLLYFAYGAIVGGPTLTRQLMWQYTSQSYRHGAGTGHGPIVWYLMALVRGLSNICAYSINELGGITLIALALVGTTQIRRDARVGICLFAAATSLVALLANPIDVYRPVLLPLAPIVVILGLIGFDSLGPLMMKPKMAALVE